MDLVSTIAFPERKIMYIKFLCLLKLVYTVNSSKCPVTVIGSSDNVGCFVDTHNRLLPHSHKFNAMENNRCLLYCKDQGYKYAGTEYGDHCYCGDDPYQYGPEDVSNDYVKDYDCNIQCLGDTEQICGGFFRLSVYATGLLSLEQGNTRYVLVSDNTMLSAPATQVLTSKYGIEECAVYCSTFVHCKVFVISMETGHCSLYNSFEVMCEGVQYVQEFKVYFMK